MKQVDILVFICVRMSTISLYIADIHPFHGCGGTGKGGGTTCVCTSLVVAVLTDLYYRVIKTEQELLHLVLISLTCGEMVAMVVHGWALQCISVTLAYW